MTIWYGSCSILQSQNGVTQAYRTQFAVFGLLKSDVGSLLDKHFEQIGMSLSWVSDPQSATDWVTSFEVVDGFNSLVSQVNEHSRVAIGLFEKIAAIDAKQSPTASRFLDVTAHRIQCMPDQKGVPFWEQSWISTDLQDLLFGQEEGQPERGTFLLVDAALRMDVIGVFDLDMLDVPVQSLFKGAAAEDLQEAAPHLIDLSLSAAALEDGQHVPRFHKDFFKRHWGKNTGIIIRTSASFDELRTHLRKFTRMQIEGSNEWRYFRFWDPRVASDYFEYIQTAPQKVLQWFCMRDGAQKVECIIGDHRAVADAWCATPRWSDIEGIEKTARPILSAAEMYFFETTKVEKFVRSTRTWILKNYGNGQEKTDEVDQFVRMQVRLLLTTGIRSEYAQLYVIAGCFLMGCHVTELPEQMGGILQKERTGQRERSELFLKTVLEQKMVSYG
jgi:hypothetical protein